MLSFLVFKILRYLESCNIPITVKRKYQVSSNTTSSNSDDDKKGSEDGMQVTQVTNTGEDVLFFTLYSNIFEYCYQVRMFIRILGCSHILPCAEVFISLLY